MMTIFKAIRVKERTHESRKPMLVPERKRVTSGFLQEEKMTRLVFHNLPKSVQLPVFHSRKTIFLVHKIGAFLSFMENSRSLRKQRFITFK